MEDRKSSSVFRLIVILLALVIPAIHSEEIRIIKSHRHKNAYAAMMYMGTPRDYEFYVATRVLVRSLVTKFEVDADVVVIASLDVPLSWVHTLEKEDGAKVVRVQNMNNPYKHQANFNSRFKLTLNKLYAWTLIEYDRVVMLDSDNLFLQKTDELFQCGQFCAAFINPCIFHTGLFVLQPSMKVFKNMLHELEIGRKNPDGADQGFLTSYFSDLLDQPLFHPPPNGTLEGTYRLPLGYQMDASYFYLQLRWSIPCGPNSVITFPSAPWLKPWYWWAWPVLPLGLLWHEQRRQTIGYDSHTSQVLIQSVIYLVVIVLTRFTRPNLSKFYYRNQDKSSLLQTSLKMTVMWSILATYIVPVILIPRTLHPLLGWALYLFGSSALASVVITAFMLPALHVLMPWLGISGALIVMANPWYSNGIVRALSVFLYAFCAAPVVWGSLMKVMACLNVSLEKEALLLRSGESTLHPEFSKLC